VKYNGSTTPPTDAGSYSVVATVTEPNYSGTASGTLVVGKAQASLTLDQLVQTYDGTPKAARVTTSPAGLTVVSVTYDGSTSAPRDIGSYAVRASLSNRNYDAPDATGTLVINGVIPQTINFAPLPPRTFGDPPFALSATGGASGNPVTFTLASNSVGCALIGSTVTITGATGSGQACSVIAHQAGSTNYLPAPDVTRSFTIERATPRIYWRPPTKLYFGTALGSAHLNAIASGIGGAPLGGTYTYMPSAGTMLDVGARTLTVNFEPANANYKPVSASVTIQVVYLTYPGHRFLEPLSFRPVFNQGQPIDVAFQLFYSDGWRPVTSAHATIEVRPLIGQDQLGDPISLGVEPVFAYDAGKQRYVFRLRTDDLDVGRYRVIARLDDGCNIAVTIEIRHGGGRDHTDGVAGLRPQAPAPTRKQPGYMLPPRWVRPRS
jgi:MBG domain